MASSSTPPVHQCQAWSEFERQAIKTYAEENPKATWRQIKRWFESEREKGRIEALEIQRRRQHIQRRITDFLGHPGTPSPFSASAP